jgi:hypothetical protein
MNTRTSRLRRQNEFSKRYQANNKAKGLCPCGRGEPRPNRVKCHQCAEDRAKYYKEHKNGEKARERANLQWQRDKCDVISYYGPDCQCCGEDFYPFLVLDHIKGQGTKQRQELKAQGRGSNFYRWLIRNDFPGGFQVLCANCNMAKGTKDHCPCQD